MVKENHPQFVSDNAELEWKTFIWCPWHQKDGRCRELLKSEALSRSSEEKPDAVSRQLLASVTVLQITNFLLSPLPSGAGLQGLCFRKALSDPPPFPLAFHYWFFSISCVIHVKLANSHPVGFRRKKLFQNILWLSSIYKQWVVVVGERLEGRALCFLCSVSRGNRGVDHAHSRVSTSCLSTS